LPRPESSLRQKSQRNSTSRTVLFKCTTHKSVGWQVFKEQQKSTYKTGNAHR